jgi:hypothetical protein
MKKLNQKMIMIFRKNKVIISVGFFVVLSVGIFIYKDYIAKGATYGWTQSSWVTGITANTATHPDDGTWDEYSAADSNITAGDTVSITSSTQTLTHDSEEDFSGGTSTGVVTTGGTISLDLP